MDESLPPEGLAPTPFTIPTLWEATNVQTLLNLAVAAVHGAVPLPLSIVAAVHVANGEIE